ncbi:MAG: LptF/LptG family permease [Bacteroidetes bacterium]|jgi:lipopolysaccharide export system permease protein|nr:LptF/LptG family permease [Bacteroidota bacterium]
MKTLHRFILKSYLGPFVMTFFISMFVFFMMFIFKYIDDFVGKGLGAGVLSELFFYFSLTTIPTALPLAILLSSLMTFGNLGEHFELTAMKSAGLSLQKIMFPLFMFTSIIALLAFYFSNNILPYTNLKAGSLLYDVRESKPALLFKDGVFNNSLEGFSIRVGKKDKDGKTLRDIMIYDHRAMQGNNIVLSAETGVMEQTPDKMFLVITLQNGVSYKEMADNAKDAETHPLIRDKFEQRIIRFDLSEFKMSRTDEALFKNNAQMMNLSQLNSVVDSLKMKIEKRKFEFGKQLNQTYYSKSTLLTGKKEDVKNNLSFYDLSKAQKLNAIEIASNIARSAKAYTESVSSDYESDVFSVDRFNTEWHRKFTLSIACVVLFFIGAPLGAIIRKGGLGMPMVVSIIFFLLFHILSITGEKLAKEGAIPPYQGMWLATIILLPVGIFLTYKATSDSNLFNADAYIQPIKRFFIRKK